MASVPFEVPLVGQSWRRETRLETLANRLVEQEVVPGLRRSVRLEFHIALEHSQLNPFALVHQVQLAIHRT